MERTNMKTRKSIPASMRWSVFARDGFTCRYCGAQAGQEGVELHADHVVSVADGGENTYDNLVTACQKCNGGKGARSLKDAPTAQSVIDRINANARNLKDQADAIEAATSAQKESEQAAINLKCSAYGTDSISMDRGEEKRIHTLCREFGADLVLDWYRCACAANVRPRNAIRYVSGCVRNYREQHPASSETAAA
jgi:HNH endonuclease